VEIFSQHELAELADDPSYVAELLSQFAGTDPDSDARSELSNALKEIASREIIDAALRTAEIDPIRRGETLSVPEFARLERAFGALGVTA